MNRDALLRRCVSTGAMIGGLTLAAVAWAGPLGAGGGLGAAGGMGGALNGTMTGAWGTGASGALGGGGQFAGRINRSDDTLLRTGGDLQDTVQAGSAAAIRSSHDMDTRRVDASAGAGGAASAHAGPGHAEGAVRTHADVDHGR